MVKVAIPVVEAEGMKSELSDHFGMARDFAVFEYNDGEVSDLRFISNDPMKRGAKSNGEFLVENDVRVVIAGSIGPHMLNILLDKGVRVFRDAEGTLAEAIEDFKAGVLNEVRTAGEMS